MAFGVIGKWMADFTINGVSITDITGFEAFKIVEEAGNQLPTFELTFRSPNTGLLSFINEGNTISAGIGVTQIDMTMNLKPMSKTVTRADASTLRFHVSGMLDALNYITNTNVKMSDSLSALSHMQAVTGQHFTNDYSTSASNDAMNWCQHGITDQAMVDHLWKHCDLGTSNFPMVGITSDGTFRARTASDVSSGGYQWNFSNSDPVGGTTVPFHYDYEIQSDTGFTNATASYPKTSDIIDLDKGPGKLFTTAVGSVLGQSANLEQSSSVLAGVAGALISNINHHANFHQSRENNVSNIANASATKLMVNNSDYFFPIKVLDVIMFSDFLEDATSIQSFSGLWIVSEVTRHIEDNKFHTMITATRESMNNVQISS